MESSTWAYIRTFTSGSSSSNQLFPCPNRASSSCTSSDLGRSRSTPGRGRTPRTVISRNGGGSDFPRCFRASSSVLAIKALTLMPRALAARRTCFANWSSSEIVVLMMHQHNVLVSVHRCRGLFQPRWESVRWRAKDRRSNIASQGLRGSRIVHPCMWLTKQRHVVCSSHRLESVGPCASGDRRSDVGTPGAAGDPGRVFPRA